MATVREELESFHRFAAERLESETTEPSFGELLVEWQERRERDSVNAAIRRGLADVEAGRVEPSDQAMESIRQEFGFAKR